ncbi:MAG: PaaI family thioesterase [Gordonia sp. (in: high G+C Gram-positive bacteria)]|uniref:PaaI family thioesterase n=1 Tax=Gordonia sp. (in: high G+C Gram-positive bacteria) TaxID=84139 RepID=UPI0039E5AAF9
MKSVFDLPENPEPLIRHPQAPAPGGEIRLHRGQCFGCSDESPVGLRLRVRTGEGLRVSAELSVEPWMQGGPGVIHGGLLAAAFDEVMGTAPLVIGIPPVTGHLEVDYAKPIPLGTVLTIEAEVVAKERRKLYIEALAHYGDRAEPMAAAHGIFIQIDVRKHFEAYKDRSAG